MVTDKKLIGWAEYIDFPDWDIAGVKAKIDTGARTSALHVENMKHLPNGDVRFDVIYSRRRPFKRKTVTARAHKWSKVRSSTGETTERCFVRAHIRIGTFEKDVEISLVSRENMLFRMLLGRKALEDHFLVDVSRRKLMSARPAKSRKSRTAS